MKKLITLLLLLNAVISFAQTTYYTTDGKNRMTEAEIKDKLSEMESKMEKAFGKKMYASLTIHETETKSDSVIAKVSFNINDKQQDKSINYGPLSEYKNREFPQFNLNTLADEKFNSEKLRLIGKPTMINFWFTGCLPCIDEMPVLNNIREKYKDDFNFIAITFEQKEEVEKFLEKYSFEFEQLINAKDFIDQLGLEKYPMNLFLDENGILRYVKGGIPYESIKGGELEMGEGNEIIEIIEKLKLP